MWAFGSYNYTNPTKQSLVNAVFRSLQPMVLAFLIEQFSYLNEDRTVEMYASASIMIGMSIIIIFLTHHSMFGLSRAGMKFRIAVSSLMYRKVRKQRKK